MSIFKDQISRLHRVLDIPIIDDKVYYDNVKALFLNREDDIKDAVDYLICNYRYKVAPPLKDWQDSIKFGCKDRGIDFGCKYNTVFFENAKKESLSVDEIKKMNSELFKKYKWMVHHEQ